MQYDTTKINSISILQVAKRLDIKLNHANKCICFAHNETAASLQFYPKTNTWYCYGCGKGSTVIDLVMHYYNIGFVEACRWLINNFSDNTYISTTRRDNIIESKIIRKKEDNNQKPDYEINKWVIDNIFLDNNGQQYLCGFRKIPLAIANQYNIKSITNTKAFFINLEMKFGVERLLKSGYYKIADKGIMRPVWWTDGLIIPYYNFYGQLQTLQMRCYKSDYAKYVFLNGIPKCLFNESIITKIPLSGVIHLCEGAIDTLSLLSKNLYAVGIPGVNTFKDEWIRMIETHKVKVVYDNDEAGIKKAKELNGNLLKSKVNSSIMYISGAKDINEMLQKEGIS